MERRKALLTAGAVSGTLFAAGTALAVSGGMLDLRADDGAGTLAPVAPVVGPASPGPSVPGDVPAIADPPPVPSVLRPDRAPLTRSEASASAPGGGGEDGEYEHNDGEPGAYRGEEGRRYEGAEDDD